MDNLNPNPKKEIKPVVTAAVTRKTRTPMIKFKEDAKTIATTLFNDFVKPGIKDLLWKVGSNGLDILLFGEPKHNKTTSSPWGSFWGGGNYYSYNSYNSPTYTPYGQQSKSTQNTPPMPVRKNIYDYDYIVFGTMSDAENVLNTLKDLISHYGIISVAEFYQAANVPSNFNDNKYGWTDLSTASIERVDGGYTIKLPKAYPIDA